MSWDQSTVMPWTRPYSEWTREQLEAGVAHSAEMQWPGNAKAIRAELARREGKS